MTDDCLQGYDPRCSPQLLPPAEIGAAHSEKSVIYVVEEQQATWLFASLSEAQAFDDKRQDKHRYSIVTSFGKEHTFNSETPDVPLEFGPGQKRCKRIQRQIHRWWKAREIWYNEPYDY